MNMRIDEKETHLNYPENPNPNWWLTKI